MDQLSSCYFCGIALDRPLQTYRVTSPTAADDLALTLCPGCHQKLDMILDAADSAVVQPVPAESAETGTLDDSDPKDILIDLDTDVQPTVINPAADEDATDTPEQNAAGTADEHTPSTHSGEADEEERDTESVADDGLTNTVETAEADEDLDARFEAEFPERLGTQDESDSEVETESAPAETASGEGNSHPEDRNQQSRNTPAREESPDDTPTWDAPAQNDIHTQDGTSTQEDSHTQGDSPVTDDSSFESDSQQERAPQGVGQETSATDPADRTPPSELSAQDYRKVMRLLQNREFPVDRHEIETIAASAYGLSRADCGTVLDVAIERGVLSEEGGQLRRPE